MLSQAEIQDFQLPTRCDHQVLRFDVAVNNAMRVSFSQSFRGLLDYPHYTRPPEFEGLRVPEVLLTGHHGEIARWRRDAAEEKTKRNRPDLLK